MVVVGIVSVVVSAVLNTKAVAAMEATVLTCAGNYLCMNDGTTFVLTVTFTLISIEDVSSIYGVVLDMSCIFAFIVTMTTFMVVA